MATDLLLDAARADQLPAANPAALKRAFETGGASLARARATSSTTWCNNGGRPRQVDSSGFEVGAQPGRDPRQGRLPQRADGAAAVRAADRAGARGAAAVQPAVDQQVLRDGPGARAQLHRVGGAARPDRLRDQLPEPDEGDGGHDDGRLPGARPAHRAGRDLRDHRRRDDRHRRAVPGRRADRDHRRLPAPGRRRPDRHPDPDQHDARLRRARRARHVHRRAHGGAARAEDGQGGDADGRVDGRHLRHAAGQRPDLQLRGRPTG